MTGVAEGKVTFEEKADRAWYDYVEENESKYDHMSDDDYFLLGDAFAQGYLWCVKQLLTGELGR